jgi:purine-nucleoside phosphorylase
MATPHISAAPGEIAPLVLMPGDPVRAGRIAADLLEDGRLVTEVRGIAGYTGSVGGQRVSVMASGMGLPSMSIYATELIRFYGVRRIIRVGTAAGIPGDLALGDVVIAASAHTDSRVSALLVPGISLSLAPSPQLLADAMAIAGAGARVGPVISTDYFYLDRPEVMDALERVGTLAIEMEAAGLYAVAAAEHAQALTVLTISDHLRSGAAMSSAERETSYQRMVEIATGALLSGPADERSG